MKFPVLWLVSVSLSAWVGTEKGVRLAWDLVSRSRITLHFGAKAVKPSNEWVISEFPLGSLSRRVQVRSLCY